MSNSSPFPGATDPFAGLTPNLVPNPPPEIPQPQDIPDVAVNASPFTEPLDVDAIIKNLILDRPLKLMIPEAIKRKFSDFEFRIINSIASETIAAHNKGFRPVTDPEASKLFDDLVAGTDKSGRIMRPLLYARPRSVGKVVQKAYRQQLAAIYAGMDPKNKQLDGKYTSPVDAKDGTFLQRDGAPWRIRVE